MIPNKYVLGLQFYIEQLNLIFSLDYKIHAELKKTKLFFNAVPIFAIKVNE